MAEACSRQTSGAASSPSAMTAATASPRERLRHVGRVAGLSDDASASPLESHSNDAWLLGDVVVRICWRGDLGRLEREALIMGHLPDSIPHPSVLDAGRDAELSWTITRRLEGDNLRDIWGSFGPPQRQGAISQ